MFFLITLIGFIYLFFLLYLGSGVPVQIMQDFCIGTHMAMWFAASILLSPTSGISPHLILPHTYPTVPPLTPPQQTPVCDACIPVSLCSHSSAPAYEWEHGVFEFLFLCQFAENYGFQIHLCPYKGHKLIIFYGCIVFHGVYVSDFPCPVYCQWAFGLVPGVCYCKQCCSERTYACVFILEWFIILWVYTQ